MDLEHLNKTQIILLTLLISFVTSIATGIVTVSLMNQAPPEVAATINHIIEKTVEKVSDSQAAAPVTTIKTIVVKNDDLTAQSIAKVRQSVIRIVAKDAPELLVARGIVIDQKGVAISDRSSLDPALSYMAILPSGMSVPATVRAAASSTSIAILDLELGTSTPKLGTATFGDPSQLQLGQSVVRIGGKGEDTVSVGVVSSLPQSGGTADMIEASVISTTPGSLLMDIFGNVVGMTTGPSMLQGSDFYSAPSLFKTAAASSDASSAATAAGAPASSSR